MFMTRRLLAIVLLTIVTGACQDKHAASPSPNPPQQPPAPQPDPTPDPETPPATQPELPLTLEPTQDRIQKVLVDAHCASCHTTAARQNNHVVLTDLATVMYEGQPPPHIHDSPLPRADLIKKGCPDQSFFYSIMKEGKMPPPPAERLSAEDLAMVAQWIKSLGPVDPKPDYCKDPTEPGDDDDDAGPGGP